jgi:hypothetical protein
MKTTRALMAGVCFGLLLTGYVTTAHADPAEVSVGHTEEFAPPPPGKAVAGEARAVDEDPAPPRPAPADAYRSPVRLEVGPVGVTAGRDLGIGLGTAIAFGSGTVGVRLAGAWLRDGVPEGAVTPAPLGSSIGQYTTELTIDFRKHGPLHPLFGLGFGVLHEGGPLGSGNAGIGVARAGLEYSLGLEEADVRLGAWVSGVLPGPASPQLADLHGYAMTGAAVSVGF